MIIGIVNHKSTNKFLPALLKSLEGGRYHVCVVQNNESSVRGALPKNVSSARLANPKGGFELGALKALMDMYPNEDDFFLLHASTVIKDHTVFDIAAQFKGSLAMCPGFGSFMGKYRREILDVVGIPIPQTRLVAIYYEKYWNEIYMNTEHKIAMIDEPLNDSRKFEMKFGRKNMVLENRYMRKWKSNWSGFRIKNFTHKK